MRNRDFAQGRLLGGICLAAMLTAMAAPAGAQTMSGETEVEANDPQTADESDTIIVTGMRRSLESAQERKRSADTVIDVIDAKELGSFPDQSVAEALQRVAGITVSRFAGSDDTSHFSAEPSSVIVRGLPQVRSEFNGRDVFSANSSRGLGYADISPELLGGVDIYKNQTADLIEGGIAGTINLRTRLPFDAPGQLISVSADAIYGDIAKQVTPQISGIYSNRWETGAGEFGILANIAYSRVKTGSQGIQFDRMGIFDVAEFGPGLSYIPSGIFLRDNTYDRKRLGAAVAAQWRSSDGAHEVAFQYNRSQYDNSWRERSIYSAAFSIYGLPTDFVGTDPTVVAPQAPTAAETAAGIRPLEFDDEGNFLSGTWFAFRPYVGEGNDNLGLGLNESGQAFFNRCYSWEGCNDLRRGAQLDTASNALRNKQWTQDFGLNYKWELSDRLRLNLDGQYVNSEVHNYNASVTARTFANTFVDLTGRYPRLEFDPANATNINLSAGGVTNANNYHYYAVTDHTEDSNGQEVALRADLEYDLDNDWLGSLKVGARYADRDQTVRWGAYNWANIANTWTYTQAGYFNIDKPVYPAGNYETAGFDRDFFAGNQTNQNDFVFFNMDKLESRESLGQALGRPSIGVGDYYPICSDAGYRAGESITGDFGCYLPSEVLTISEQTTAAYAKLRFGGPNARLGGIGVSGNLGARVVWTKDVTSGAFTLPTPFTASQLTCSAGPVVDGRPTVTAGCVTTAEEIAFNTGGVTSNTAEANHFHVLPSFNLKLDFTDKIVSRFAYSRAISRPDVGLLRNYVQVSRLSPNLTDLSNPDIVFDGSGNITGYNFRYTGRSGNPYLEPIVANQFDLSFEYYFQPGGSFTVVGFYKQFENYIQNGTYNLTVNSGGVTRDVLVQGPANGNGASIQGAEFSFQTFFNFLPGVLSGFGVQANYTYVDNKGVETTNLVPETAAGTGGGGVSYDDTAVKPNALEGISEHTFNLVGMYERGRVSARVAYNWRSKYLVTAIDCCVGLPIWQDASGYMDASIRYRFTDWLEMSLEGSNLLSTDTVLSQQVDNDGTLKPNAWFKNDRRFQLGARIRF